MNITKPDVLLLSLVSAVVLSSVSCFDMYNDIWGSLNLRVGIFLTTDSGNQLFYLDSNNNPVERSTRLPGLPAVTYQKGIPIDYDHDGDSDIAVITDVNDVLYILLNDGKGSFLNYEYYSLPGISVTDMEAADLNYDRKPEFVITQNLSNTFIYTPGGIANSLPTIDGKAAIGKLNNDEKPDFYLSLAAGGTGNIIINPDENGNSVVAPIVHTSSDVVFDSTICDIDSDGDNDIIFLKDTGMVEVYKNNGYGFFNNSAPDFSCYIVNSYTVTAGDIDNDGDSDFFIGNYQTGSGSDLLINKGSGNFTIKHISVDIEYCSLFDIDFDGDLDVIGVSLPGAGSLKLLTNDGRGDFSLHSSIATLPPQSISVFTFNDE